MPVYKAPGVYVEEIPGTPPIQPVGTSTPGFIGAVDPTVNNPDGSAFTMPDKPDGSGKFTLTPANQVELVTSFAQFTTKFGDFQSGNAVLAHSVYGFFNNGGSRCFIVRTNDLTDATEVGNSLKKLEPVDEVAIVAAPGALRADVQLKVIEHCENMKYRFAILDGQRVTDIQVANIQGTVRDSAFAALYFPWIAVSDPITRGRAFIPPAGLLAGIYARVDETRGVHKAPANEVVRGALDLEYPVSKAEQEGVNLAGINIIRSFNGTIRVWGARTLGGSANGEFIYINVRRLMIFIEESIDEGTQFVVFEPNNLALWQKITRTVTAFLTNVWRDGALFGATPEEAFYVKCDSTTNTDATLQLGQVITEIGVAITRPAEFVIFRITQKALGAP